MDMPPENNKKDENDIPYINETLFNSTSNKNNSNNTNLAENNSNNTNLAENNSNNTNLAENNFNTNLAENNFNTNSNENNSNNTNLDENNFNTNSNENNSNNTNLDENKTKPEELFEIDTDRLQQQLEKSAEINQTDLLDNNQQLINKQSINLFPENKVKEEHKTKLLSIYRNVLNQKKIEETMINIFNSLGLIICTMIIMILLYYLFLIAIDNISGYWIDDLSNIYNISYDPIFNTKVSLNGQEIDCNDIKIEDSRIFFINYKGKIKELVKIK